MFYWWKILLFEHVRHSKVLGNQIILIVFFSEAGPFMGLAANLQRSRKNCSRVLINLL